PGPITHRPDVTGGRGSAPPLLRSPQGWRPGPYLGEGRQLRSAYPYRLGEHVGCPGGAASRAQQQQHRYEQREQERQRHARGEHHSQHGERKRNRRPELGLGPPAIELTVDLALRLLTQQPQRQQWKIALQVPRV